MREFTLKDVTYDFKLAKKYNFTTIFDKPAVLIANPQAGTGCCSELTVYAHKQELYKNKNLTATRANNLIDGKDEK